MTSGVFHLVPLDSITVKRDERQRRELLEIDVLADSIRRLGLIHPVVVTRDLELVAGERRLAACRSLHWTTIAVQYVDELDPLTLRAIELEENIKRKDISWTDEVKAVNEYHELRLSQDSEWTKKDTADAIGISPPHLTRLLHVQEEMTRGNPLVLGASKLSTAAGITERARERREQAQITKLHETIEPRVNKDNAEETILNVDFTAWILSDPAPRFNFIHCDFPYGIDADNFNQGGAESHGGYIDTPETWDQLMMALDYTTSKLTTPSAHLMFWFAMRKGDKRLYEPTARNLTQMGWDINPIPLIWMKSDGAGIIPDPERGPRQTYETCFLGSRGDRKIVRAVANAYAAPTVRDRHMSEKPEPMLRHFFNMLVDENTIMLDPTCGSGSSVRAAESLGAKYTIGLEINQEFASDARTTLERARKLRAAS